MDWDVSVNAPPATEPEQDDLVVSDAQKSSAADLGPCLYFGPAGQRCRSRATASGFCPRHRSNANLSTSQADAPLVSPKRVSAILTIVALLWPVLADIVRELIRYFR